MPLALAKESMRNMVVFVLVLLFILMFVYLIYNQITEHYAQMDPMLSHIRSHLNPLHPTVENLNFYQGDKSYTINKQKIYLCLRDEQGEYYDFNMLIYVTIHELAHVLCDEIGHTEKFHQIFDSLLKKATGMGLYDSTKPIIQNYCGHK
jgi:hypothetical protein